MSVYFRRNFDMHWSDGYSTEELDEMDRKSAIEGTRRSTLDNIVPIIERLEHRIAELEKKTRDA